MLGWTIKRQLTARHLRYESTCRRPIEISLDHNARQCVVYFRDSDMSYLLKNLPANTKLDSDGRGKMSVLSRAAVHCGVAAISVVGVSLGAPPVARAQEAAGVATPQADSGA